jgi:ubiquinone/menaquinone biosynthesis C-methylase UbiE
MQQAVLAAIGISASEPYDRYVRAEWALFSNQPARGTITREAVRDVEIARVLDVGCGAGQELRPFLGGSSRTLGVGVDVSAEAGHAGRELFAADYPDSRVAFIRAPAEHLPFRSASFDVVICRLALPYTDNVRALAEMARIVRPGGALILKFHHARYYGLKLWDSLATGRIKSALHACRVLLAGGVYHLTGSQPRGRIIGGETFQTMWLLERELRRLRLEVRRVLADSVPAAPTLLIGRASEPRIAARSQRASRPALRADCSDRNPL